MLIKADRFEEDAKKAFPKRLKPLPITELVEFDEKKLYVVNIVRPQQKSTYIYLFICVFLVLFICMFPIWPLWVKIYMWWTLFIILVSLLCLILLRLVIYFLCYIIGYDVWILPNILDEKMSFVESLSPIIGYYPRTDDWLTIALRVSFFVFLLVIFQQLYSNPGVLDYFYEWVSYFYNETLAWGIQKLTNYHNTNKSLTVMDKHERIMKSMNEF